MVFSQRTLVTAGTILLLAIVFLIASRGGWRGFAGLASTDPSPEASAPADGDAAVETGDSPLRRSAGSDRSASAGESLPGFRAITDEAGIRFRMRFLPNEQGENFKINLYDHGCGVAVGDVNGDGHDDIYFCNQLGANALYRNDGHGRFQDVTADSGPIDLTGRVSVGATFSDYDNDGDQDLFVTSTRGGNSLFQNDGTGVFLDVTQEAGVHLVAHSQTGTFFDFDLDGDLDLVVTNSAAWTTSQFSDSEGYYLGVGGLVQLWESPKEENVCYRNNGDGTFTEVTQAVGLEGCGWAGDTAVLDYDEDGRPDILITNMFGQSRLYRNQPDGTFANVTADVLGRTSWGAIGSLACDFTNQGHLDLYVADMHSDMWMPFKTRAEQIKENVKYSTITGPRASESPELAVVEQQFAHMFRVDYHDVLFGNSLFKNLGNGRFEEYSDRAGAETFWPWGLAAGDFDNDGYQDVFVPSGMGFPYCYWRNYLLMNQGDGTFRDRSRALGIEPRPGGPYQPEKLRGMPVPRSSRCAATGDFDGDGKLDLIVANFNDAPYYYQNQFSPRHYVQFRLQGVRSNRDAIGAVVRLFRGEQVLTRQVNSAGGYLSHSSKTLHFGLGDSDQIDRVEIRWPSGAVQVLDSPRSDQRHTIVEPS